MEGFGKRLKELRQTAKITQSDLADKLNLHPQTVSKWERGLSEPDIAQLGELAAALGISLEKLLGREETEISYVGTFRAEAFGKMLSELRAGRGESQEALAAAALTSPDAVSRWERGITCPDIERLSALAEHFEVPVSKLYCGYSEAPAAESVAFIKKRKRISAVSIAAAAILLLAGILAFALLWQSRAPNLYTVTLDGNEVSVSENDWFTPQTPATSGDPASETLVVYFSWSGNTQEMANYIADQTDAYLVEIVPEEPYEGSYNDVAYGRAQTEAETNARPAVSQATYDLIDMENYDTVLIGFPIWWHTAPMVIGTFLEHYDWTAQDNIYPFFQGASNSNQDYYDNSMNFVRTCAEGATVREGLYCDEGATQTIDEYLTANGLVGTAQAPEDWGSVLVVYFSAQGHTEAVAGYIAEATGGDVFELVPVDPYTADDLRWTDDNSRVVQEYENEELRDVELVSATPENWESYDTVFLGYPIWWGIAAWPVNGFVAANDFTGKTVVPFCTSASSGLGDSGRQLADLAGEGNWLTRYRFRSSASESDVRDWLGDLGVI